MDLKSIQKVDNVIQKWLSENRMMAATPEMVFPRLVEEGLYSDSEEDFSTFMKKIKQLSRKEKRELLNVRTIGVDVKFQSRY